MTNTANYNLPQWEASDRIRRSDFNAAMQSIDTALPKIVFGSYEGDESATRTISLDFTPKAVLICPKYNAHVVNVNNDYHMVCGGLMAQGLPIYQDFRLIPSQTVYNTTVAAEIVDHGFTVRSSNTPITFSNHYFYANLNSGAMSYYYLAIG